MQHPDQEVDTVAGNIIDYLSEAFVQQEMGIEEYEHLCSHLTEGLDWLQRNKGLTLKDMQ